MSKTHAYIETKAYPPRFKKHVKSGWGCGYVFIPIDYHCAKEHIERMETATNSKGYVSPYFRSINFSQEITYTQFEKVREFEYLVIGFDTAHVHNDDSHDRDYVQSETLRMLELIEQYEITMSKNNFEDAHAMSILHPKTFEFPSSKEFKELKINEHVKVCTEGERFWIKIESIDFQSQIIYGKVDNDLVNTEAHNLKIGDSVEVEFINVYQILKL